MEQSILQEEIIKTIRAFFYRQSFHEIIPPILNTALPLEPNLRPFVTTRLQGNTTENFYLAMSPERGIKQMLAQGMGNCFAIAKSFRNYERTGSLHFNEFLMLEWYRKEAVYTDIMRDAENLLRTTNEEMKNKIAIPEGPFARVSLNDLFKLKTGEKLEALIQDEELLRSVAQKKGYSVDGATWEELYDQLFVNEIESTFPKEPFFLVDFPARVSPLCKKHPSRQLFAERFELYINGIEIGNGNTENTDTASIRALFEKEHVKTGMPIDEEFLSSLEQMKKHSYAGVGIGIERLAIVFSNAV